MFKPTYKQRAQYNLNHNLNARLQQGEKVILREKAIRYRQLLSTLEGSIEQINKVLQETKNSKDYKVQISSIESALKDVSKHIDEESLIQIELDKQEQLKRDKKEAVRKYRMEVRNMKNPPSRMEIQREIQHIEKFF